MNHAIRLCVAVLFGAQLLGAFVALTARPAQADEFASTVIEFFEVTASEDLLKSIKAVAVNAFVPRLSALNPGKEQLVRELVEEELQRALDEMSKVMEARLIEVYGQNFTLEEMRQLVAFYRSPLGIKLLQMQPSISRETVALSKTTGQASAERAVKYIFERFHKEGLALPSGGI